MADDRELILALQSGSLEALGVLYDRHQQLVFRTALGITGDNEAAADLLQDIFLRLHRFACHVDPQRPLEPWLYRMTANLAYTWVKRNQRWLPSLEEVSEWLAGNRKSDHQLPIAEAEDMYPLVQQAVQALPLPQRIVVVLYYVNDLSLQEISEILDVPVGTVKSRLHYGREVMKRHLGLSQIERSSDLQCEFT